jgi:hypothetical protein
MFVDTINGVKMNIIQILQKYNIFMLKLSIQNPDVFEKLRCPKNIF